MNQSEIDSNYEELQASFKKRTGKDAKNDVGLFLEYCKFRTMEINNHLLEQVLKELKAKK